MSLENVEIVRRAFAALGDAKAGNLTDDALAELFAPTVEWVPVAEGLLSGDRYDGYQGLRRFYLDFFATWDEFGSFPEEIREVGDRVVVRMRMVGRVEGLQIDEVWSALWTIRGGRITRIEAFASSDGAHEALGLRE